MSLDSRDVPAIVKVMCASLAGMSTTTICFPLDVVRLRMQVSGEGIKRKNDNSMLVTRNIIKNEGFRQLYNGISASLLRQILYTGTRLGTFQIMIDYFKRDGVPTTTSTRTLSGMLCGCIGAILGLPPDVAMTRMAVDNSLPVNERRNYKHVFDAITRITREEGVPALTTGLNITVLRAMVASVSQFVFYVEFKDFFIKRGLLDDNVTCHIVGSAFTTIASTSSTLPFDIAKTRLQKMKITNGIPEYKNFVDVWYKVISKEGFFGLWKGFTPYLLKTMPYSLILFLVYEDVLINNYKTYILNK